MKPRSDRAWLAKLIRRVTEASAAPAVACADAAAFATWQAAALADRGFAVGALSDRLAALEYRDEARGFADYVLLNATAHLMELGDALVRGHLPGLPRLHRAHILLTAAAWLVGDDALVDACERLPRTDDDPTVGAVSGRLADALTRRALAPNHPLLGHPFHHLLVYADSLLFSEVVWRLAATGEAPEVSDLQRAQGHAGTTVYEAISACVALAAADGQVDPDEQRLLDSLYGVAGLDDTEKAMLRAEITDPPAPAQLAARITDAAQQRFVLRLLFLTAYINGNLDPAERGFIEALAGAFGLTPDCVARAEFEALASYQGYADLPSRLSLGRVFDRARARLTGRLEALIQTNAARIWAEIRETGELGQLLLREAAGEPASPEDRERALAQLKDLARVVPALAIFAAPGGTILLPLLAKHLPIDLRPSSFKADDSAL